MEPDPDREWVLACQERDGAEREEAFRVLYQRHHARVHAVCLRISADAGEALDATQETFLLAFRGIRSFGFRARFARWLLRIAAHVAIELRRGRRPPQPLGELDELVPAALGADPVDSAERRELRLRVRRTLRRLSPPLRAAMVLRHLRGHAYADVGRRLAIPEGSVKSRLSRAQEAWVWSAEFPELAAERPRSVSTASRAS